MKSVCMLVQHDYASDVRVRRKAEALIAAGYSVDVLALRAAKSKDRDYTLGGVNVFTVSLGKKRGSLIRYAFEYAAFFAWAFYKLSRLMRKKHYAMVEVNNLPDLLVFAAVYARWKGAKVVFDMHEITPEFYISKYGMRPDSRVVKVLKYLERASFDFADHVITINEPIRDLLESRGLEKVKTTVIMNSADEALFVQPTTGEAKVKESTFVMMYHGTLTRIYGLDIAIEAFARAQEGMPGSELWILGGGPEASSLQELSRRLGLEGKVKFLGSVPPREIRQWLELCDVGVLATRKDIFLDFSFSNKLTEYIIMGKPVIASRLKAIRHYLSDQALAYFEPNDPSDLAKQMTRLYREPELRAKLAGSASREYIPINWGVMKQRYLQMVATLLGIECATEPRSRATADGSALPPHANRDAVVQ